MSASVVDQFEMAIRMACLPCQNAPPVQQVPSACTLAITFRVVSSSPNCWAAHGWQAARYPTPPMWVSRSTGTSSAPAAGEAAA